jgi:hypothetical protein
VKNHSHTLQRLSLALFALLAGVEALAAQSFSQGGGFIQPAEGNGAVGSGGLAPRFSGGQNATENPRMFPAANSATGAPTWARAENDSWLEKQGDAPPQPTEQATQEPTAGSQEKSEKQPEEKKEEQEKEDEKKDEKKEEKKKDEEKKWYEKYRFRGYAQLRINEVLEEEGADAQLVGDSSVGADQGFIIRRARLIFQGDITDRIGVYLQPDFAATPNGSVDSIQFTQIRDWYSDIHLDDDKVYRFRVGQSKIPYGWENMQSSQNRLPLDRNDALNSAARNERDLGVFYYYTPKSAQELFKYVLDENLKGSGNYGLFGVGFYNGQGGSFREQNDNLHFITRLAVPKALASGQIVEWGLMGYTGMYSVLGSPISPLGVGPAVTPLGTSNTNNPDGIVDKRAAATFVYYPQPLGFQAEWTVGRGPGLNDAQTAVIDRSLYGGYAMVMYRYVTCDHGEFWPFARYNYYQGGYKSERNAPFSLIEEWELGLEWQFNKSLEFVTMYTFTDRTNTRAISSANTESYQQFVGDLLRFQLQWNY